MKDEEFNPLAFLPSTLGEARKVPGGAVWCTGLTTAQDYGTDIRGTITFDFYVSSEEYKRLKENQNKLKEESTLRMLRELY
jgi:hypothetical protein